MDPSGGIVQAPRRLKPPAPPPPQKVKKCDPLDVEIQDVSSIFSVSSRKGLIKPPQEQAKDPLGLAFRKLDDQTQSENGEGGRSQTKTDDENKVPLTHNGEKLLAKFYAMFYTNDGTEKEWKLEVDGFIPVCFVQVYGNANKPFRIIAVEKTKRIMEYQVTVNTTCARNSTFVKWQDGVSMFGVRFAKDDQAEQFFSTVKRMASTLAKAAQLLKQPERKVFQHISINLDKTAAIKQMSDPASSGNIHHTKVSLMIKLPDKQTTIMSVPGLLTMSELFETICEKENLNTAEHQLSLPRTGARKVTFDSGTAVGSLTIREVSIIRTVLSANNVGSAEVEEESFEDLLDLEGEESKILHIFLPNGTRRSYRVSTDMTMKQLVMRVCSRERLNPRHHSLQYIDFKHEFLDMTSTVDEIEVNQIRLMDKRGRNVSRSSISDDNSPTNDTKHFKFRKSSGVDLESDLPPVIPGEHKETSTSWQRSKSLDVLSDDREPEVFSEPDGQVVDKSIPKHSAANGSVPSAVRRHSSGSGSTKKPPVVPMPYASKTSSLPKKPPRDMSNGSLKTSTFSPIKKDGIISASTPDLSLLSAKSDDSPGSGNIKTSTPDAKTKRRAAPPPPPRPVAPRALFTDGKPDAPANKPGLLMKTSTLMPGTNPLSAPSPADVKLKPSHKKRPAPPRPPRPVPPRHPARRGSTESKDSRSSEEDFGKKEDVRTQFKQNGSIPRTDRVALSLDLDPTIRAYQEDENGEDDLRGVPIFIPPPPPDELPPPLDECETPVGPLTDFETDILEGSPGESFPVTVNGFVGIGKYLAPSQTQTIENETGQSAEFQNPALWSKTEAALATVAEDDSISVVPPPRMYSETPESSSSEIRLEKEPTIVSNKRNLAFVFPDLRNKVSTQSLRDIPPPSLETEATSTSQHSEEKGRDSGLDESPENLDISPPSDSSENVPVQSREDVDSGSNLDVVSTIPPPVDFATTRPVTPPCQFANATVAPPEGFVEEEVKGKEPEKAQPRKKLNVSEALFPWMNKPQAPINATVPLAVSLDNKGAPEDEKPQETLQDGEKMFINGGDGAKSQDSSASAVVSITSIIASQGHQSQSEGESSIKELRPKDEEQDVKGVREVLNIELPEALSCDGRATQKVELPGSNAVKTDEVAAVSVSSIKSECSGSRNASNPLTNTFRPEVKAKPVRRPVHKEEIKLEPGVTDTQQAGSVFYPSLEVAREEPETTAAKPEPQVVAVKPETKIKPVISVKEEVKVVNSSLVNRERPELPLKPVKLEVQVKPEKQETEEEPVTVVKEEAGVTVEVHITSVSHLPGGDTKSELGLELVEIKPTVKSEKTETPNPSTLIKDEKVDFEAYAPSSCNPAVNDKQKPDKAEKAKVQVKPEKPESNIKPGTLALEKEIKLEVDAPEYSGDLSMKPPQFEKVQPASQGESVKSENAESLDVQEVIVPQLRPVLESSIKVVDKEQPVFAVSSLNEAALEANTSLPKATTTIVPTGNDDVIVESLVTPETKTTPSPLDTFKDLAERLQELDEGSVPSISNSKTSGNSKAVSAAYHEPTVPSKDHFVEDVIVAETKQVEFSVYNQFEELLKLDNREIKAVNAGGKVKEDLPVNAIVEEQYPPDQGSSSNEAPDSDLHLDLSSLQKSPEPPRPPSSSPPSVAVLPRSSILPSPRELLSDGSTESGISLTEQPRGPATLYTNEKTEYTPVQTSHTQSARGTGAARQHPTEEKPTKAPFKLQRPLSMPAGHLSDLTSDIVQKDLKSTVQSDSRKSSTSESTGVSSSSLPSSPVESDQHGNTELVDLPKPPPFTVPPLRRYSDLAHDLSFVSSAAKAAVKSREDAPEPSAPPKPANSFLKRNSFSVEERPRSWVGPETSSKNVDKSQESASKPSAPPKPINSALKRSSFSVEGRPRSCMVLETNNKSVEKSQESASKPSAPPKPINSALKRSSFSVEERPLSWMGPETNNKNASNDNNKRPGMFSSAFKPVSFSVPGKPVARPVEFNAKQFNTPTALPGAPSANNHVVSINEKLQVKSSLKTSDEPQKPTPVEAEKAEGNSKSVSSLAPEVSPLSTDKTTRAHQPTSTDVNNNPQSKKSEPHEAKYEIVFSGSPSETQIASQDQLNKTVNGSRQSSKNVSGSSSIREQILRDASGGNRVTRARPQSAVFGGSKFQVFSSDEKTTGLNGGHWADVKKLAALQSGSTKGVGASWVKRQANEPSNPDLPHVAPKPAPQEKTVTVKLHSREVESKPQPVNIVGGKQQQQVVADTKKHPVKTTDTTPQPVKSTADVTPQPAVNNGSLPNVVMRTKTEPHDLTKRHSMPTYIIEGADRNQPLKVNGGGRQFNFVMQKVKTDTTVVPQGVVAAMKALREKEGNTEGSKYGEVDLENTLWV